MKKLWTFAPVAVGVAALEVSMDDWLRLGVEVALGITAVLIGDHSPPDGTANRGPHLRADKTLVSTPLF